MEKLSYDTLFLDRDGVINVHIPNDYVKSVDEFIFIDGVPEAIRILSLLFTRIVVVTNQRGVGKGLMNQADLENIHAYMTETIFAHGGRIDRIYVATTLDNAHPDRKPNTGLALQAKRDFPDLDFSRSLMAGDSLSDMQFANNADIPAVLIGNKYKDETIASVRIHARFPDLITFAEHLIQTPDSPFRGRGHISTLSH
ncbi:MAG: HAD-IIIA family hydrolase [Candidatus Symbiothrix sp.]|jgi:histidinol-phosphate phosphatase family protein|nr:HAD-IIIA family hydrolase [Candidatus Symbiothrix sp.]